MKAKTVKNSLNEWNPFRKKQSEELPVAPPVPEPEENFEELMFAGDVILSVFKKEGFENAKIDRVKPFKKYGGGLKIFIKDHKTDYYFTVYKEDGSVYYGGNTWEQWEDWNIGNIVRDQPTVKHALGEILYDESQKWYNEWMNEFGDSESQKWFTQRYQKERNDESAKAKTVRESLNEYESGKQIKTVCGAEGTVTELFSNVGNDEEGYPIGKLQ